MNDAIVIRPLRETDADAVVALFSEVASVEPRLGPITMSQWQRFATLPQNYGCRDFRIAEQNGHLIGLAESSRRVQGTRASRFLKIVVTPKARRQRIGLRLFDDVMAIDEPDGDISVMALVSPQWHAGMAFVSALGFEHTESEISMKCIEPMAPPRNNASDRTTIERAGDASAHAAEVARIHNMAYAADASFSPYSPAEMSRVLDDYELWTASEDGQLAGFCMTEPGHDSLWIESVAVDPAKQGRGIGKALIYRALDAHAVSLNYPCWLNTSSKALPALAMYRQIGFRPQHETCRFRASRGQLLAARARRFG